jgi:hypothetical protein
VAEGPPSRSDRLFLAPPASARLAHDCSRLRRGDLAATGYLAAAEVGDRRLTSSKSTRVVVQSGVVLSVTCTAETAVRPFADIEIGYLEEFCAEFFDNTKLRNSIADLDDERLFSEVCCDHL